MIANPGLQPEHEQLYHQALELKQPSESAS
jgi:hypothetical protein